MPAKETKLVFSNVGLNDHVPYSKADLVKVSRVSDNFSLSFYQIDYQAMAAILNMPSPEVPSSERLGTSYLMPVGKIVLDTKGFQQLLIEIDQIKKSMPD